MLIACPAEKNQMNVLSSCRHAHSQMQNTKTQQTLTELKLLTKNLFGSTHKGKRVATQHSLTVEPGTRYLTLIGPNNIIIYLPVTSCVYRLDTHTYVWTIYTVSRGILVHIIYGGSCTCSYSLHLECMYK